MATYQFGKTTAVVSSPPEWENVLKLHIIAETRIFYVVETVCWLRLKMTAKDILKYKLKMHLGSHAGLCPGPKGRLHGGGT